MTNQTNNFEIDALRADLMFTKFMEALRSDINYKFGSKSFEKAANQFAIS